MQTFKYLDIDLPHRLKRYLIRELKKAKKDEWLTMHSEYVLQSLKKNWRRPNWKRFIANRPTRKKFIRHIYMNWYSELYLRLEHCIIPKKTNTMPKENIGKLITIRKLPF